MGEPGDGSIKLVWVEASCVSKRLQLAQIRGWDSQDSEVCLELLLFVSGSHNSRSTRALERGIHAMQLNAAEDAAALLGESTLRYPCREFSMAPLQNHA